MSRKAGLGSHERAREGGTNVWLTPRDVIEALGPFDLDPCAAAEDPLRCAPVGYTEDGLERPWFGLVWCNPPYGPHVGPWLARCASHGSAIALVFARTETQVMQEALRAADGVLFVAGRFKFERPDGAKTTSNAGAPSMLLAFGWEAVDRIEASGIDGVFFSQSVEEYQ